MFYINTLLSLFLLSLFMPSFARDKMQITNNLSFRPVLRLSDALQLNYPSFDINSEPNQGFENQPTSAMALFPKYFSLLAVLKHTEYGSVYSRVDYLENRPFHLGLYQKSQSVHEFLLKDLYWKIRIPTHDFNIWAGIRTFEYAPIHLFALPNPFDQISLQGFGLEYENIQFSASLNKGTVKTISTVFTTDPATQQTIESLKVNENNNPYYYEVNEYIATIFVSGRLLLAEGRLFEPIFAFRYYSGGRSKVNPSPNETIYRAKASSALIAGGVFSRPITNGITGTTTLWFSSLPSDELVTSQTLPINNRYSGAGRVSANTPRNTIGLLDASEFYFSNELALLTAFYATNNTYPSYYPVLKVSGDGLCLLPDNKVKANSNNKFSLNLQPIAFISKHILAGTDFNFNYVSEKLFYDDANGMTISPLAKWVFNGKFNSQQFLFTSLSYGIYDWKIKKYKNNSQTNSLITFQVGAKLEL